MFFCCFFLNCGDFKLSLPLFKNENKKQKQKTKVASSRPFERSAGKETFFLGGPYNVAGRGFQDFLELGSPCILMPRCGTVCCRVGAAGQTYQLRDCPTRCGRVGKFCIPHWDGVHGTSSESWHADNVWSCRKAFKIVLVGSTPRLGISWKRKKKTRQNAPDAHRTIRNTRCSKSFNRVESTERALCGAWSDWSLTELGRCTAVTLRRWITAL